MEQGMKNSLGDIFKNDKTVIAFVAIALVMCLGGLIVGMMVMRSVGETSSVERIEITKLVPQTVEVTRLVEVEKIIEVTSQSEPTPTTIEDETVEEIKQEWNQDVITLLEKLDYVGRVNLVQFIEGGFVIELQTLFQIQNYQAEASYEIVTMLSEVLTIWDPQTRLKLTGSEELTLILTTFSANGENRYVSETDFETMEKVRDRSISRDEWVILANAGFR